MWQAMYDRVRPTRTKSTAPGHFTNNHPSGRDCYPGSGHDVPTPALFSVKVPPAKPIVVTVRHPDHENETHVFGPQIIEVDIDLGYSFDVSNISHRDWDDVLAWAVSLYQEADDLPDSAEGREAAAFIRSVAEETLQAARDA